MFQMWISGDYQLDAYPVADKISLTTFFLKCGFRTQGGVENPNEKIQRTVYLTFALCKI